MNADRRLAAAFLRTHPANAAALLEQAEAATGAAVVGSVQSPVIAAALHQMAPADAAAILICLPDTQKLEVLSAASLSTAAQMLRSLAREEQARLLAAIPEESARSLRLAIVHPEESAGSLMDANILAVRSNLSVGEARRRVRRRSNRTGNYLYLVDEERRLVGAVALSKLISASPIASLSTLMSSDAVCLPVHAGVEQVLNHPGWREFHALPVVDAERTLVGIFRRETYERLREDRARKRGDRSSGVGIALAELVWTAMLSTMDGVGRAIRPSAAEAAAEASDDS